MKVLSHNHCIAREFSLLSVCLYVPCHVSLFFSNSIFLSASLCLYNPPCFCLSTSFSVFLSLSRLLLALSLSSFPSLVLFVCSFPLSSLPVPPFPMSRRLVLSPPLYFLTPCLFLADSFSLPQFLSVCDPVPLFLSGSSPGDSGNWIEIAYGTSSGGVRVIVQHPETVGSGPQLFQTFTVHRSPVTKIMLSEKHLISGESHPAALGISVPARRMALLGA